MTTTDPTPLAEQIAREHPLNMVGGCRACRTGDLGKMTRERLAEYAAHIAAVTEQAVVERITTKIEAVSLDGLAIHANTAQAITRYMVRAARGESDD